MCASAQCGLCERKLTVIRQMASNPEVHLKEKDKQMNKRSNDSRLLTRSMALVLTGFLFGCGGGGGGGGGGSDALTPAAAAAAAAAAAGLTLSVPVGAGTGVGGAGVGP